MTKAGKNLFKPGDIVISRAGHDEGRHYVVVEAEGEFALVCDGDYRKLTLPKKKRCKHLRFVSAGSLPEKPTDTKIKTILKQHRKEQKEQENR